MKKVENTILTSESIQLSLKKGGVKELFLLNCL